MRIRTFSFALTALLLIAVWPALAWAADPAACNTSGDLLAEGWVWAFAGAFGAGFLTSLTPCVYPMIPIVVGVFGARDENVSRGKAFMLATMYVLGMGVMYAALGVVFALIGKQFGTILADPWVVWPLVIFYAALAASMFGAFEINLPASWQNKLNQVGGKGYGGAFGMGLVGGLTAAPCTGPILAGILTWVAQTKNVVAGSTLLFTYAIGMGVLFWIIAAFAVSLPKSGRWMEGVKSFGGIALLAVAIYFLRPIIPALEQFGNASNMFLIGSILLIVGGIALGAVHLSFHGPVLHKVRKGVGVVLVLVGITGTISWLLTPDRHLPWINKEIEEPLVAETTAFERARAQGKGVMIDFAANWCAPCKELELTFAEEGVYETIVDGFIPLKFDVSLGTELDEKLQAKYGADTLPAVIFLDGHGNEIGRVDKYLPKEPFLKIAKPAALVAKGQGTIDGADDPCITDSVGVAPRRGDALGQARSGRNTAGHMATTSVPATATATAPAVATAPAAATAAAMATAAGRTPTATSGRSATAAGQMPATAPNPGSNPGGNPGAEAPPAQAAAKAPPKELIPWLDNEVAAFVEAEFSGKGVLIDFYASWCPPCIAMKRTFRDPAVAAAINKAYVPVKIDVTEMTPELEAKLMAFNVQELPALVALSADGEEWVRITDYKPPAQLLKLLPH